MNWEANCNGTWVGNMHAWHEVKPNPLPLWKRFIGKVMYKCSKCGEFREGFSKTEGEWL
jgi:hypothetical protein